MVLSKRFKSQEKEARKARVEALHDQARVLYYEHMMYSINDSLTSILAICDTEAKETVPKIKYFIQKINGALEDTKNYQKCSASEAKFQVSMILTNLKRAIEDNHKEAKITWLLSEIKAMVRTDQSTFERLFLTLMVHLIPEKVGADESELVIELRQKDQDARITLVKEGFSPSKALREDIEAFNQSEAFKGLVQMTTQGGGVEISLTLPLQFEAKLRVETKPQYKPLPKFAQNAPQS